MWHMAPPAPVHVPHPMCASRGPFARPQPLRTPGPRASPPAPVHVSRPLCAPPGPCALPLAARGGRLLPFVRDPPPQVEVGRRPLGGGGLIRGGGREGRLGRGVQVGQFGVPLPPLALPLG